MDTYRKRRAWGRSLAAIGGVAAIGLAGSGLDGVAAAAAPAAGGGSLVVTDKGPVRGTVSADTREFLGVPYAAPPVRWGSPQAAKAWSSPRDATKPGNACAQNAGFFGEKASDSEDCLYLNVTTPRRSAKGKRLPVMVWIHGSGFRNGSGALYRPARMAARGDVIVVTVNYRLGIFGFLDHPSLDGGPARNRSGNFGLEDQQAALGWVRRNAAAFGGDARNVTVFGESAGGVSTCSQLTAPGAAGLFQRAIVQSGPCTVENWPDWDGTLEPSGAWLPRPRGKAERQGQAVAAKLGCPAPATAAACLRALPTSKLLKESEYGFAPVYGGGGVLPYSPKRALLDGRFAKVPVMYGMTRDEYRTFEAAQQLMGVPPLADEAEYAARVRAYVGAEKAPKVLARYPLRDYGSPSEAWSALVTDATFARSVTDLGRSVASRVPAYAYEFADAESPWVANVRKPGFPTGAFHAAELQYQFETDYFDESRLSAAQRNLADQMTGYWTRFARTGDPNGAGAPTWREGGNATQVLAPGEGGIRRIDFAKEHGYTFWKNL
ncbi:carboxylesterase/lipase family protein [Actinomadura sp. NEAU-AAG7]|uniref:carboxylesterase/lipase family protein n=1 Tax=Actinomadura sp. NEAU-AAG7 TaxID=2839640 RepID=UPI001BE4DD00|nr:carboxylesterase family protein [Actinomadura sp. NEAU-AAG7]MBT2207686.1 carboxylesterase family protein [Actinomadura sp. NEAU-AAG7]